jgi:diamine N-acetyltransferase
MLRGGDIVLRPLQESDLDFLESIENNKGNWQFGSERKHFNRQELFDYIANAKTDIKLAKQYRFVIDLNSVPIGFIDLFDYTLTSAGVGVIISKNYRNKGFAKEALNLISDYAFKFLNLKKINCSIKKDNLFSDQLFTSCGFVFLREVKRLRYFVKLAKK